MEQEVKDVKTWRRVTNQWLQLSIFEHVPKIGVSNVDSIVVILAIIII